MDDELIHDEELEMEDEQVVVAGDDSLSMVMIVFTTIFLLIGIGIVVSELTNLYDVGGDPIGKVSRRK